MIDTTLLHELRHRLGRSPHCHGGLVGKGAENSSSAWAVRGVVRMIDAITQHCEMVNERGVPDDYGGIYMSLERAEELRRDRLRPKMQWSDIHCDIPPPVSPTRWQRIKAGLIRLVERLPG